MYAEMIHTKMKVASHCSPFWSDPQKKRPKIVGSSHDTKTTTEKPGEHVTEVDKGRQHFIFASCLWKLLLLTKWHHTADSKTDAKLSALYSGVASCRLQLLQYFVLCSEGHVYICRKPWSCNQDWLHPDKSMFDYMHKKLWMLVLVASKLVCTCA